MPRYTPSNKIKTSNFIKLGPGHEKLRFLDVEPEERQRERVWDSTQNKPVDYDPEIHEPQYEVIFSVERIGSTTPQMVSVSPYVAQLLSEDLATYEQKYGVGGFYMEIWKDQTNGKTMTRFRFAELHKGDDVDIPF